MKRCVCLLAAVAFTVGMMASAGMAADKVTMAGIVFQEDQFFRIIELGMQDAAKKAGVEMLLANSNNKPEKELELVNTYVARGVQAIVISPISKTASAAALKAAAAKGIKIIAYNSTVEGDFVSSFISSSGTELGKSSGEAAVKYIKEKLGGKANVAVLCFDSQVPEQSAERVNGFIEALKAGGVETKLVSRQDAWLAEMATKKVGDIITANPDVNIIYAANEGGTVGATMAVKAAGKAGKIAVFGIDASEQLCGFLLADDGILQAITGQKPFDIGSMSVNTALKVLKGEKAEALTIVPGLLLQRSAPEKVKEFVAWLKTVVK